MSSTGALKLLEVYQNVEQVLAVELFMAAQGLDFRNPLRPGKGVEVVHEFVRDAIPHADTDHYVKDDIGKAVGLLQNRTMVQEVKNN